LITIIGDAFSLELPSKLAFRPSTGIRSSTSFYSTLHIYLVIGIYNEPCVILMLVTKWKQGQSKGKGVSVRDIYTATNDNETEQASSLIVERAGTRTVVFECWGARRRVDTGAFSRSNKQG